MTRRPPLTTPDPAAAIDRSVKALARQIPPAFFRLAGLDLDPALIRPEDTAVHPPEFRADQVFLLTNAAGVVRKAFYFEYQLQPDRRKLSTWFSKAGGLTGQLGVPVILVAFYLTQGRYRRFPSRYTAREGNLCTELRFDTVRLWEHAERIRGGELAPLAPLLPLCENEPTERTLREGREMILGLEVAPQTRAEMLAVAATVGLRYFPRAVVETTFREELQMLKDAGFIQEWIEEGIEKGLEKGLQQGIEQGIEQGLEQGIERGRAEDAREFLLRLLEARFGALPEAAVTRIRQEGPEWCQETGVRAIAATSLADLGL